MKENPRFLDFAQPHFPQGGQFAIAYALLQVAEAVQRLGNGNAATEVGAIEGLGMHLCESLDRIAEAVA